MDIMLILKEKNRDKIKVIVELHARQLIQSVEMLIEENRKKEAFDLILNRAQVKTVVPLKSKSVILPDIVLVEEDL